VVHIVVQGDVTKRAATRPPPRLPLAVQTATFNARVLSSQSSYLVDASCFVLPSLYVVDCASPWGVVFAKSPISSESVGSGGLARSLVSQESAGSEGLARSPVSQDRAVCRRFPRTRGFW